MNASRRALLGGLAALPAVAAAPALAMRPSETPDQALDALFSGPGAAPAMGAAIVGREGLRWSGVRGVRRHGEADAVTGVDRWHLGSNTKAMTCALFARLVEQGRARWTMPLAEAFPDVALDLAWGDATLDDLMQHRAGLLDTDVIGRDWLASARNDPASLPEQRAVIAARALGKQPGGPRGTFAYGNANYILLGAAIERITGVAWEDAMRAEVFAPLGIASGGFGPPQGDNPWGHRGAAGQYMGVPSASPFADNPLALGPAGTAHMTLADYALFLAVFLNDGAGWLSPETVQILTTPAPGAGPGFGYAKGWGVVSDPQDAATLGTMLAHEGSNTLWHVLAIVSAQAGMAVVTVSNSYAPQTDGQLVERLLQLSTVA